MKNILVVLWLLALPASANRLWDALASHKFQKAKTILSHGFYIDFKEEGVSAITLAALRNDPKICQFLLDHGADIEDSDALGVTPLMSATKAGSKSVVELLLKRGASLTMRSKEGYTPLMYAAMANDLEIVKILVKKGANVADASTAEYAPTALFLSLQSTDPHIFDFFYSKSDPRQRMGDGRTLLMAAVNARRPLLVQKILADQAEIDAVDRDSCTALMREIYNGCDSAMVDLLLQLGANPNARCRNNRSPLMVASYKKLPIVELLLRYKADVNTLDDEDKSALWYALSSRRADIARVLLANGAKVGDTPKRIESSDYCKVIKSESDLILSVLAKGGFNLNTICYNSNTKNYYSAYTLLSEASFNKWTEVVSFAIRNGADSRVKNLKGLTVVEDAFEHRNWGAFRSLIEGSAFFNSTLASASFLWAIEQDSCSQVIVKLVAAGANVDRRDTTGMTPLMIACDKKKVETVQTLLQLGADVTLRNDVGATALHYAAEANCMQCVIALVNKNVEMNALDRAGRTPLLVSANNVDLRRFLIENGADPDDREDDNTPPEMYEEGD